MNIAGKALLIAHLALFGTNISAQSAPEPYMRLPVDVSFKNIFKDYAGIQVGCSLSAGKAFQPVAEGWVVIAQRDQVIANAGQTRIIRIASFDEDFVQTVTVDMHKTKTGPDPALWTHGSCGFTFLVSVADGKMRDTGPIDLADEHSIGFLSASTCDWAFDGSRDPGTIDPSDLETCSRPGTEPVFDVRFDRKPLPGLDD